jgi:alpha-tubulin suppressor-like RCC1 family protein
VWIENNSGKLEPVMVRTGITDGKFTEITSRSLKEGDQVVLGVTTNGEVWAWGLNDRGQVGDGTTEIRLTPVKISEANPLNPASLFGGCNSHFKVFVVSAFHFSCVLFNLP